MLNFRLLLCIIKVVSEVSISLQLFVSSMHFLNLSELPFGDFILCSFFTKNSGSHLHKMISKCTYSQKQYSIKSNDAIMRFTNLLLYYWKNAKQNFLLVRATLWVPTSTTFTIFHQKTFLQIFICIFISEARVLQIIDQGMKKKINLWEFFL